MIEVEKKAWIDEPDKFLKELKAKAEFVHESKKEDLYYIKRNDNNVKEFDSRDKIFRIRTESEKIIVTFKEKTFRDGAEVNIEEEFEIFDKEAFKAFGKYLGFELLVEKTKEVKLFKYNNISVEFAYLHHLGHFIEIEILCESDSEVDKAILDIQQVLSDFNIDPAKIEEKMYIELLLEK